MSKKTEAPKKPVRAKTYPYIVYIQFDGSKKPYTFGTELEHRTGDHVVVETIHGQEIGTVYVPSFPYDPSKVHGELKGILRVATARDLERKAENVEEAKKAFALCAATIERLGLDMHLISCEYTLDRSKVVFTYVSDDRVDFRGLLKELASKVSGRIELRQVGPRNKAKLVGGIGSCGMECCCSRFMSDFDTVSINMAKNQLLALNISKLSGQCGKLKCCLRFENDAYSELRRDLPRLNSQIEYNGNRYRISSMNVLQKQAKLENREETLFVGFDELFPSRKSEADNESTEKLPQ